MGALFSQEMLQAGAVKGLSDVVIVEWDTWWVWFVELHVHVLVTSSVSVQCSQLNSGQSISSS